MNKQELELRAKSRRAYAAIPMNLFGTPQIQSRYCPDHEGVMVERIGERVYQCPLDKVVYDYDKGFKPVDKPAVGPGSVADQTPMNPEFYQSPRILLQ